MSSQVKQISLESTKAKNRFGELLEQVRDGVVVVITKSNREAAVVLSPSEYKGLLAGQVDPLAALRAQFDARFERMQTPEARKRADALFKATPAELGKTAVKVAAKKAAK